jgi:hypothetical protein
MGNEKPTGSAVWLLGGYWKGAKTLNEKPRVSGFAKQCRSTHSTIFYGQRPMTKQSGSPPRLITFLLFGVVGIAVLGMSISTLSTKIAVVRGDSPARQEQPRQQAQTEPDSSQSQRGDSVTSTSERKSRYLVARDSYRGKALETLSDEIQSNLVCSRKAYFRTQADIWGGQTGGSPEKWLRDNLTVIKSKVKSNPKSFTGLSGEPVQFEASKVALDLLAALAALQDVQDGKPQRPCQTNLAIALDDLGQFQESDATYEALKARYAESLQQKEKPTDDNNS